MHILLSGAAEASPNDVDECLNELETFQLGAEPDVECSLCLAVDLV
jgi:hypothetical protein